MVTWKVPFRSSSFLFLKGIRIDGDIRKAVIEVQAFSRRCSDVCDKTKWMGKEDIEERRRRGHRRAVTKTKGICRGEGGIAYNPLKKSSDLRPRSIPPKQNERWRKRAK